MRVVFIALMLLLAAPAMAQTTTPQQVLQAAVRLSIRPAMLDFRNRADGLAIAMNALCRTPSEGMLALAKGQFRQAALAYGRVEFLRIGPLMEDNRADRLLFWPDRRGIGLRQVQAILAEAEASATALETLRQAAGGVRRRSYRNRSAGNAGGAGVAWARGGAGRAYQPHHAIR